MRLTIQNIEKIINLDLSSKWYPYSEGFKVTKIFSHENNYQIRIENDIKYTLNVISCTLVLNRNPKYRDGNPLYELLIPNSYGINEDIVFISKEQLETIDSMCALLVNAIDRVYERLEQERLLDPITQ